jgi:dimethylamine/trimethylamine dehydrogenase
MGEEWRRGWHPEKFNTSRIKDTVLIIGAGPAGLEAAVTLGRRGVNVQLAEARREPGGRVSLESRLPGLSEWSRVRHWREQQIGKLPNVTIFRESPMAAEDAIAAEAGHIVLATGSTWRSNGLGRSSPTPIASYADSRTLTPDDIMTGRRPDGPVVIFDDDKYYMASAIALLRAREGHEITFVSSDGVVSSWSSLTAEQAQVQSALIEAGIKIIVNKTVAQLSDGAAQLSCVYTGRTESIACEGFIPVTSRSPNDDLWNELRALKSRGVHRIGDCKAPGLIAHAVYDGHRFAREFDVEGVVPAALRERVVI